MPSALCARAWVSSTRGVGLRQANILHCRAKPFGWKTKSCEVGFDECTRLDVGALVVDRRRYRTDGVEDGPHDDRVLERCWFERSALDALRAEARRPSFLETGGALLGWRNDTEAAVARVLEPGPRARHGLSHFEPDGEWQVSRGREIYAASGRTIAYLGDWHSHPRGHPNPSRQDRKTVRQMASDPDFRAPEPLYAIIGRPFRRPSWQLVVYVFETDALRPVEVVVYDST